MTTLAAARARLGVAPDAGWDTIRAAYLERIRHAHPDRGGDPQASAEINNAYRVLRVAQRAGDLDTAVPEEPSPAPPPTPRRPTGPGIADDVRLLDDTTIVLGSPPAESFRRLVEAAHAIGAISYIDRSAGIFEAILRVDERTHASLVVSLQWRAHDATTEAFCTLEALERAESLDVRAAIASLISFLPPDSGA